MENNITIIDTASETTLEEENIRLTNIIHTLNKENDLFLIDLF